LCAAAQRQKFIQNSKLIGTFGNEGLVAPSRIEAAAIGSVMLQIMHDWVIKFLTPRGPTV
jgi:hypothetical protein